MYTKHNFNKFSLVLKHESTNVLYVFEVLICKQLLKKYFSCNYMGKFCLLDLNEINLIIFLVVKTYTSLKPYFIKSIKKV